MTDFLDMYTNEIKHYSFMYISNLSLNIHTISFSTRKLIRIPQFLIPAARVDAASETNAAHVRTAYSLRSNI